MCPISLTGPAVSDPVDHLDASQSVVPSFVPSEVLSRAAYGHAAAHLPHSILNHSLRVYFHASSLASRENSDWVSDASRRALLFTACVLHDIGTATIHDGPQRFEVEAGDFAAQLLRAHHITEADIHEVWVAIALHTTPGIAERISALARLIRLAVLIDFKRPDHMHLVTEDEIQAHETLLPRLQIEKELGDVVVEQALRQRTKAPPASWPGLLLRATLDEPDWDGVNKAF